MIWIGIGIGVVVGILGTIGICCVIGGAQCSRYEERVAQAIRDGWKEDEIYFGFKPLTQEKIDRG
jgi:hypothetical protein